MYDRSMGSGTREYAENDSNWLHVRVRMFQSLAYFVEASVFPPRIDWPKSLVNAQTNCEGSLA